MLGPNDFQGQNRVTIEPSGKLTIPKRVIKNAGTARAIYYTLRAEHIKRIYLCAEIDGLIAGNPPYDPNELQSAGLLSIANFNTLEPRAMYEKNAQAYWNLLYTSEYIVKFNIRSKDPQAHTASDAMARHWNDVIRTMWQSFDINMSVMSAQLVKYGISPVVWVSEKSPFWRVAEYNKFFVPDQSASDMDLLSNVCIETEYPVVYLLEIYEEFKDRRNDTSWDIDALEKFLAWKANSPYKDNPLPNDLVELQRKLYQGDIMYDRMYNETVRMISLFYKEGNGTITHYMFHRDWTEKDPVTDGFLYINDGQYTDFKQLFLLFTQSPGEQYIHGNRGLGHKMYPLCQAKMMMDNSLVDGARWAATPIVKSPSMTVKEAESVRFIPGVMTNIGAMEFQQNNLGDNLQGIIATSGYIGNLLEKNAAYSGDNSGQPDDSMGSVNPEVFRLGAYKEFNVLRNQISHYYKSLDELFSQMHIRLCNTQSSDGKSYEVYTEWKDRCMEDGVPEELLKCPKNKMNKMLTVKATRTAGAGSQVGHLIGLKEIEPLVGTFGKRAQVTYIQDKIKAALGPEFVEAYTQDMLDPDELGGGGSLAQLENNDMQEGKQPLVEPSNDQKTHITIHMQFAKQIIEAIVQKQLDAIGAVKIFTPLVPHLKEHLQYLEGSIFAKDYVKNMSKEISEVERFATVTKRNAETQLAAQQAEQQKDQEKTQETLTDIQRKDAVAKADIDRKNAESQQKEARADDASKNKKTQLKRKTDAEVEAIRKKASAKNGTPVANPGEELAGLVNDGNSPNPFDFE